MSPNSDPFANGGDPFAQNASGADLNADPFAQVATPTADGNDPFSQMNAVTEPAVLGASPIAENVSLDKGVSLGKKGKNEKPAKAKKEKVVKVKKEKVVNAPKQKRPTGPYTWALWSVFGACVIAMVFSLFIFGVQYGFAMKP